MIFKPQRCRRVVLLQLQDLSCPQGELWMASPPQLEAHIKHCRSPNPIISTNCAYLRLTSKRSSNEYPKLMQQLWRMTYLHHQHHLMLGRQHQAVGLHQNLEN